MIFEFEATGKNIEKAIENALFELKAIRDDVDIKILDQGGLFKKARVLVSISEDAREKYIKKEQAKTAEVENTIEEATKEVFEEIKEIEKVAEEIVEETTKEIEEVEKEFALKENIDAEEFIRGLMQVSGCGEELVVLKEEGTTKIEISGKNATNLIGFRGECMNAIQNIASAIENENAETKQRVILDIENYRSRREESLKALANRMYNKVKKTNKAVKLEPMSANDRRIIHTALSEFEDVDTISKGTEPNRYIVILPAGSEEN
ncbi:MAG: Jag N-terminal domain-containing protein [Clostridia bacterium]|nr:Jag N-terminal domain-containing protein [Clostridia bacterium]